MLISHRHRFIFIHVNKVAGTSIASALEPHSDFRSYSAGFGGSLMRRIAARSSFFFPHAHYPNHIKMKNLKRLLPRRIYLNYFKFAFVRNPWDRYISNYFYNRQYTNAPLHLEANAVSNLEQFMYRNQKDRLFPQVEYLYDRKGNCLVDFVGRYETLNESFDEISNQLNLIIKLKKQNTTNHSNFRTYFSDSTENLIRSWYRKDIQTFDYEFKD